MLRSVLGGVVSGVPPVRPSVLLCAEDNYTCQPGPRRAGLALQRPAVLRPFRTGAPVEDVLITAADPASLVLDGTDVICPRGCGGLDVGITLAAIVGSGATVAGYAAVLDFVRADLPPTQPYLARSFRTHKVISRRVVGSADPRGGRNLTLTVDGVLRQSGSTTAMIATPDELVQTIARCYPLRPGDLVLTGSPAGRPVDRGTGWVGPGSRVRGEISGVGCLSVAVRAEDHRCG